MFKRHQNEQPETTTRKWSRGEKIAGWTLVIGALALIAACLVIPEVRRFFGLEREPSVAVLTPAPAQMPAPAPPNNKVFGVFAKNVEELRKNNNVKLMKEVESGKMLSEIPAGSFGFVAEAFISNALKYSRINELELQPHVPLDRFEIS